MPPVPSHKSPNQQRQESAQAQDQFKLKIHIIKSAFGANLATRIFPTASGERLLAELIRDSTSLGQNAPINPWTVP